MEASLPRKACKIYALSYLPMSWELLAWNRSSQLVLYLRNRSQGTPLLTERDQGIGHITLNFKLRSWKGSRP